MSWRNDLTTYFYFVQFQLDGSLALNYVIFKADRIFSPSAIYHPALLEHQYLGKAEESEGVEPKTGSTPRTLQRYQSCCRCHSTLSLKTRGSKRGFSHFWVVGWQARDTGEHWPIEFSIRWKEMSGLLQLQRIYQLQIRSWYNSISKFIIFFFPTFRSFSCGSLLPHEN